ncbi:type II secretion system protein [Patescibacteria group bacterium]
MKKAFTLIEILVVVFIIAILSTLIIINLNSSRAKARDAKRKTDLGGIKTALEIYADNYSFYPEEAQYMGAMEDGSLAGCEASSNPFTGINDFSTGSLYCQRKQLELEGSWPQDPRGYPQWDKFVDVDSEDTENYNYGYSSGNSDGTGYVLGCSLESGNQAHKLWGYIVGINRPRDADGYIDPRF